MKTPCRLSGCGNLMEYVGLECKSALHPNKHKMPCSWDLNIYRGCEHGCRYCYALYSHKYLNDDRFFDRVYYKSNIVKCLEKQLSSKNWKHEAVNIGGVTDSYQPIEEKLRIMPEILKILIRYKTPAILATKSDLVLRDIDYLRKLSDVADIKVSLTITTIDKALQRSLEPNAAAPDRRIEALRILREEGISAGITLMPVIPYLTDSYENLDSIYNEASKASVEYIRPNVLYLIGKTRTNFLNFLNTYDHSLYEKMKNLYRYDFPPQEYLKGFNHKINLLKDKYGIPSWASLKKSEVHTQTALTDF